MKKLFLLLSIVLGTFVIAHAGELKGTTPFGNFIIQDSELDGQVFQSDYYMSGTDQITNMMMPNSSGGGSFPVYYHTSDGDGMFTFHFDSGATMSDIIGTLCALFNLHDPKIG